MLLLSNAVEMEDSCWEMRLRCGRIFFVLLLSLHLAILNLRLLIFLVNFIVLLFANDKGILLLYIESIFKRGGLHTPGDYTPLLHANFGTNAQFLRHRVIIWNECPVKIQRLFCDFQHAVLISHFSDDTVHDVCRGAKSTHHGDHHCTLFEDPVTPCQAASTQQQKQQGAYLCAVPVLWSN